MREGSVLSIQPYVVEDWSAIPQRRKERICKENTMLLVGFEIG
jgi:hypothetical protein